MVHGDLHLGPAAVGVDDHVDLALVHADGRPADGLLGQIQLLEGHFHLAGGLAGADQVAALHVIGQFDGLHSVSPPSVR